MLNFEDEAALVILIYSGDCLFVCFVQMQKCPEQRDFSYLTSCLGIDNWHSVVNVVSFLFHILTDMFQTLPLADATGREVEPQSNTGAS